MKVLVTGTPGTGKTTLVRKAKAAGLDYFYDADDIQGLCEWRRLSDGNVLGDASAEHMPSDPAWYKINGWYWKLDFLDSFIKQPKNVVIAGSSENIADSYKLFDKVIVLTQTPMRLKENLLSAERANPFGKYETHIQGIVEWQDCILSTAKPYSPLIISDDDLNIVLKKNPHQSQQLALLTSEC